MLVLGILQRHWWFTSKRLHYPWSNLQNLTTSGVTEFSVFRTHLIRTVRSEHTSFVLLTGRMLSIHRNDHLEFLTANADWRVRFSKVQIDLSGRFPCLTTSSTSPLPLSHQATIYVEPCVDRCGNLIQSTRQSDINLMVCCKRLGKPIGPKTWHVKPNTATEWTEPFNTI